MSKTKESVKNGVKIKKEEFFVGISVKAISANQFEWVVINRNTTTFKEVLSGTGIESTLQKAFSEAQYVWYSQV